MDDTGTAMMLRAYPGPQIGIDGLKKRLLDLGHELVEQDMPGLWRIDGGPELTQGQMLQVAAEILHPGGFPDILRALPR